MTTDTLTASAQADLVPSFEQMSEDLRHRMYGAEPWVFLKAARWVVRFTRNRSIREFDPTIDRSDRDSGTVWQQCSILFRTIEVAPKDMNAIAAALRVTKDSGDHDLLVLMEIARTGIHPDTIVDAIHLGYDLATTYHALTAHGPVFFAQAVAAGITPTEIHDFAILGRDRLGFLIALRNTTAYPVSHSHLPRVPGL